MTALGRATRFETRSAGRRRGAMEMRGWGNAVQRLHGEPIRPDRVDRVEPRCYRVDTVGRRPRHRVVAYIGDTLTRCPGGVE